jgi:hypothetical protein
MAAELVLPWREPYSLLSLQFLVFLHSGSEIHFGRTRWNLLHPVRTDIAQAQKLFWMHTMEQIGDVGHVESRFGTFRDSANLKAR